jgi:PAT family beta-lactamase induction signal transducer AmpG
MPLLYAVIGADNLSAGLAVAAFIAFLSSLTNISFTAVQYAIFSSLMTLLPKVLGGYSGSIVEQMGYPQFFVMTTLLTIPVILLILLAGKRFDGQVTMAK